MSALALKLIACLSMLLDHIGFCIPRLLPLRVIGRLAFPLYVFLLTEGYRHTSSRPRYALRLLIFAVLAQIPFSLMCWKDPLQPHGSVMVTLLICFLCIWVLDACRGNRLLRALSWLFVAGVCALYHFELLKSDYGARGVLLAVSFFCLAPPEKGRGRDQIVLRMLALLFCAFVSVFCEELLTNGVQVLKYVTRQPYSIASVSPWMRTQAFSLLSIPLIVLYNRRKGWQPASLPARKAMQYGFYLFYPVHMLILYLTIR